MIVVWDFDLTLFDTARLMEDEQRAFAEWGIDRTRFNQAYQAVVRPGGYGYDPERHLSQLGRHLNKAARDSIRRHIDLMVADAASYLFPGAVDLVYRLSERGFRQVLLTLGNRAWQQRKVAASGLEELMDEVLAVEEGKPEAVATLASQDDLLVVNDNSREMVGMMRAVPSARFILVDGPKANLDDTGLRPVDGIAGVSRAMKEMGIEI